MLASTKLRPFALIAAVALSLCFGHGALAPADAGAAQATPTADQAQAGGVACDNEPTNPRRFRAALDAASPAPLETLTLDTVPPGEPVEAAVQESVAATVETALACRNAGDFERAYGLLTDRMIGQLFGSRDTVPPEILRALDAQPDRVRRIQRVSLVELAPASLLPDGRVGAVVVTANATHTFTDYLFFAEVDGQWLIDQAIVISVEPNPAATPVP